MTEAPDRYRGYHIGLASYSPAAAFDWSFYHEDYDGAPDSGDNRHGRGASRADCAAQIDEIEDAFTPDAEDIAAAKANADGWGFNSDYAEDAA